MYTKVSFFYYKGDNRPKAVFYQGCFNSSSLTKTGQLGTNCENYEKVCSGSMFFGVARSSNIVSKSEYAKYTAFTFLHNQFTLNNKNESVNIYFQK